MADSDYDREARPRKRARQRSQSPRDDVHPERRSRFGKDADPTSHSRNSYNDYKKSLHRVSREDRDKPHQSRRKHSSSPGSDRSSERRYKSRDNDRRRERRNGDGRDRSRSRGFPRRRPTSRSGERFRSRSRSRSRTRSRSRSQSREQHRLKGEKGDRRNDRHGRGNGGHRKSRQHRSPSRSRSRSGSRSRSRSRSESQTRRRSPVGRNRRIRNEERQQEYQRSKAPLPSQNEAFTYKKGKDRYHNGGDGDGRSRGDGSATAIATTKATSGDKQKPNFGLTGKLAASSNTIQTANQTIVLKYHEPSGARKPPSREPWRLYVFKDETIIETIPLSDQSCWLFGREHAVADFPLDHTSCSKQHAVIQFRYVDKVINEFGDREGKVKPYVIDLESANGTSVNGMSVPVAKYVELRDGDVVTFGHSSREYVVQLAS